MNSYINVPTHQMKNYAQGYTKKDVPVRMSPGVLASEAYAVKSCTADMIGFIEANMQVAKLDGKLQRALADTDKGYFKSGAMIQGLIWEQYPFPVALKQVLGGNSDTMIYQATIATKLSPPLQLSGIVILANKNYPIDARVTAAYEILTALGSQTGSKTER
jgi:beta-lactamase class C